MAALQNHSCRNALLGTPLDGDQPAAVEVWIMGPEPFNSDESKLDDVLSDQERARARRFVDRRQATVWKRVRAALRLHLSGRLRTAPAELRFEPGAHGKPSCGGIAFNVSHSAAVGVIALASPDAEGLQLGIDIEALENRRDHTALARMVFTECEQRELARQPRELRPRSFMRGWTRKEAWLKARGTGLGFGASRVHTGLGRDPGIAVIDGVADERARLFELAAPEGYLLSLCIVEPGGPGHV